MRWARRSIRWTLLLLVSLAPLPAHASGADLFGFGVRSQGLAGTGVAYADGYESTYGNPARLAARPEKTLGLGWSASRFTPGINGLTTPQSRLELSDGTQALLIGATAPLPFPDPVADRLVLGVGLSTAGSAIARVRIFNEDHAQFPLLGTRAESLNLNVGLGARLPGHINVGFGTLILATLNGTVAVDAGGDTGAARNITDSELTFTTAPLFGVSVQPWKDFTAGAVWRSRLYSEFDLLVTIEGLGMLVLPPLHITGLAQIDPSQLAAEASYVLGRLRFVAGVTHKNWSSVERFKDPTVQCPSESELAARSVEVLGREQDNSDFQCAPKTAQQLGLKDTIVPRAALEYELPLSDYASAQLRVGFFHEPTPLPPQSGDSRIFDSSRNAFTVGYEVSLTRPLVLSAGAAFQLHHLIEREHDITVQGTPVTTDGNIYTFSSAVEVGF